MQWTKFRDLTASGPVVASCIHWHMLPLPLRENRWHLDYTRKSWVEKQVDFIAVRPWSSLDLNSTDVDTTRCIGEYTVWYHDGGEEHECAHSQTLYANGEDLTIAQAIGIAKAWHRKYRARKAGHILTIDAVSYHTILWQQPDDDSVYKESLEIYIPPANFKP